MMKTLASVLVIVISSSVLSQNWITTGGNLQKNGVTKMTGPVTQSLYWQVNSTNSSLWGNSIFTWGNKFVSSRVTFTPSYRAKLELRDLTNGALIWERAIADTSIMYAVGFNEDAVYANDYKTSKLYALNISDGSVKWVVNSSMFGGNCGILYAPNGDVITFGKRLDRQTGTVVWSNNYIIPVGPDESYCIYGNTYYHWTGSIVTPKKLIAIDLTTGATKYTSADLPGDGDQENDIIIGPDGVIYITRDGGALYAFNDNGTAFVQKWVNTSGPIVKGFGNDGTVYAQSTTGKLIRINPATGTAIDSTSTAYGSQLYTRLVVSADSTVYLNTGETGSGRYAALVPNLQTEKWTFASPYNYYSCPGIGKEGVMVLIGAGTQITAYKTALNNLKPVADFYASSRTVIVGSSINFTDLSSYAPTGWQWAFTGGTPPSATQQNPASITYNTLGTYDVRLIAGNGFGTDTLVRVAYINVVPFIGIRQISEIIPSRFMVHQNYPNPFNPTTKIRFSIPNTGGNSMTSITIYDASGRMVESVLNRQISAGTYEAEWDGSKYSSGVYFYRIENRDFAETKKMILMK